MEHPKDQWSSSNTENASPTDSLSDLESSSTSGSLPNGEFWEASTPSECPADDHLPLLRDWATKKNLQIKIELDKILQSDHKDILNKAWFQTENKFAGPRQGQYTAQMAKYFTTRYQVMMLAT